MKKFLENLFYTLKDKRFSWKFKLCNIITNDWLRSELAMVSAYRYNLDSFIKERIDDRKYEPTIYTYELIVNSAKRNLERQKEHIDNIWKI